MAMLIKTLKTKRLASGKCPYMVQLQQTVFQNHFLPRHPMEDNEYHYWFSPLKRDGFTILGNENLPKNLSKILLPQKKPTSTQTETNPPAATYKDVPRFVLGTYLASRRRFSSGSHEGVAGFTIPLFNRGDDLHVRTPRYSFPATFDMSRCAAESFQAPLPYALITELP
ncbi:hypothetical protein CEXT_126381 [Caerostris extrusa]|uniref:Ribosomal protein L5 n=1 Tax=Caerostris extrusa TaxID=172846 RepID=A0AAV4XEI1_CAEEX|nr:hypothetical protein CEXT_126381 [Caerostris extrusa]